MTSAWRDRLVPAAPVAVIGFLALLYPAEDGPTVCPFALCTGMACPGCGMTRAATHLIRGQLSTALEYHPLIPLVAVVSAGIWARYLLRRWGKASPLPHRWVNLALIGLGILFLGVWVVRFATGTLPPV